MRALVAAAVLPLLGACSSNHSGTSVPGPITVTPERQPVAVNAPIGLTTSGSDLWVVSAGDGTVQQRDAITGRLLHSVAVGTTPLRVVATSTLVWVSVFGADQVKAIDPESGRVVHDVAVPGQPEGLAVLGDQVWVVRQAAEEVTAIGPDGVLGRSVRVGSEPRLDVAAGRYLVVSNFTAGTLTRVDPASGTAFTSAHLCAGPQGMAYAAGSLWVACTSQNVVLRVDPTTMRSLASVPVPGEPDAVHAGAGGVLVTATSGPTLYTISSAGAQARVTTVRRASDAAALYDQANVDSASVPGATWVSSFSENRIWRVPTS